jgi:hypothetical protein
LIIEIYLELVLLFFGIYLELVLLFFGACGNLVGDNETIFRCAAPQSVCIAFYYKNRRCAAP